MKAITFNQKALLCIYLIGTVIFGALNADKDFLSVFEGNKIYLWYTLLLIYYGVLLLLTIWIVSFLIVLFYKIANKENFDRQKTTKLSIWLLIIVLFTHLIVLFMNKFIYGGTEVLLLFIIPITIVIISIIKDTSIIGFRKFIAIIPLIGYVIFDVISLRSFI